MQAMPSSLQDSSTTTTTTTQQMQIHDDFFEHMLSTLPSTWPDLDSAAAAPYDESTLLASRLRQYQISSNGGGSPAASGKTPVMFQLNPHQLILNSLSRSPAAADAGGLLPLPLPLKSPNSTGGGEGLFNGFGVSMQQRAANQQHFHPAQQQNFGAAPGGGGGVVAPPRQRVRARRGQATDPHSIAERLRRERIAERMKALQELVPNANKTDKASMLDEIIDYVKFLQLQVKVLSMSRLGGAAAVAPLVADISSEGRNGNNGSGGALANDSLTVTEQQVAKLMEEDMGSAMQYLQGKGLCLMPISLASAISTATCHPRVNPGLVPNHNGGSADSPSSPNLSVLTVQSAVAGGADRERSSV